MSLLDDIGDGGIPPSQPRNVTHRTSGKVYRLRSFLEPMRVYAVGGVMIEDLRALEAEIDRLRQNACYNLIVRPRATGQAVFDAVERCELVFIVAHGSRDVPYFTVGGLTGQQIPPASPNVRAGLVWIGACFGLQTVQALNSQRYQTLPPGDFEADGTTSRSAMIRGLTAQLSRLRATQCEVPTCVCVLVGVAEVHAE